MSENWTVAWDCRPESGKLRFVPQQLCCVTLCKLLNLSEPEGGFICRKDI